MTPESGRSPHLDSATVADADPAIADRNFARALEVVDQVAAQAVDPDERRILTAASDLLRAVGGRFEPGPVLAKELRRALSR